MADLDILCDDNLFLGLHAGLIYIVSKAREFGLDLHQWWDIEELLILQGRFLRFNYDLRAYLIGLKNLKVVSIDQILDDNIICQLNQVLVGIIEVDLE